MAAAWTAAALLAGCSMSTQWFIQKSLRDAGFSRAEAGCAVDGIAGQLGRDQLWSLRGPLVGYVMLDDPATSMDIDQLLAWLRSKVSPEVHHVLSHYAARCRTPG